MRRPGAFLPTLCPSTGNKTFRRNTTHHSLELGAGWETPQSLRTALVVGFWLIRRVRREIFGLLSLPCDWPVPATSHGHSRNAFGSGLKTGLGTG